MESLILQSYVSFLIKYKKAILSLFLIVTLALAVNIIFLTINASPYFLDISHPARQNLAAHRDTFSGANETTVVALAPESGTVFTKETLQLVQQIVAGIRQIQLIDQARDVKRLSALTQAIAQSQPEFTWLHDILNDNLIDQSDLPLLRQLKERAPQYSALADELIKRLVPVRRIRSLVDVDHVHGQGDTVEIAPLIDVLPETAAEINAIEALAQSNHMLWGSLIAYDKSSTMIQVEFNLAPDDTSLLVEINRQIEAIATGLAQGHQVYLGGPPVFMNEMGEVLKRDNVRFFPLVITVISIILFWGFRHFYGVVLPLTVATITLVMTLGIMGMLGMSLNMVTAVLPVFITATSVADAIHFLNAYNKLLAQNHSVESAMYKTCDQQYTALLMTSITNFLGFIGLAFTQLTVIKEFGLMVALGVVLAFIVTMTVLPCCLLLFPAKSKLTTDDNVGETISRSALFIWRMGYQNPLPFFTLFIALMVAGIYIAKDIEVNYHSVKSFAEDSTVARGDAFINKHYGGSIPLHLWIKSTNGEAGDALSPQLLKAVEKIQTELGQIDHIGYSVSVVDYITWIDRVMNQTAQNQLPDNLTKELAAQYLVLFENSSGQDIFDVIDSSKQQLSVTALVDTDSTIALNKTLADVNAVVIKHLPPGYSYSLTGFAPLSHAAGSEIVTGQLNSIGASLISIVVILFILFRTVLDTTLAMLPILCTLTFNFALMQVVGIDLDIGTAMISAISFGVGVDYAIHFFETYRQCKKLGLTTNDAVAETLKMVSKPIFVNSVALAGGFAVLIVSGFSPLHNLGILIAGCMMLSAFLTITLLPICYSLLSRDKNGLTVEVESPMPLS